MRSAEEIKGRARITLGEVLFHADLLELIIPAEADGVLRFDGDGALNEGHGGIFDEWR